MLTQHYRPVSCSSSQNHLYLFTPRSSAFVGALSEFWDLARSRENHPPSVVGWKHLWCPEILNVMPAPADRGTSGEEAGLVSSAHITLHLTPLCFQSLPARSRRVTISHICYLSKTPRLQMNVYTHAYVAQWFSNLVSIRISVAR